jgi:hypothetical protein
MGRRVFVVGVGMIKFEKPGKRDWDYPKMGAVAGKKALWDAGIRYDEIDQAVTHSLPIFSSIDHLHFQHFVLLASDSFIHSWFAPWMDPLDARLHRSWATCTVTAPAASARSTRSG